MVATVVRRRTLPPPHGGGYWNKTPNPAEQRAIAAMGLAEFVSALDKQQIIKRTANSHKNQ